MFEQKYNWQTDKWTQKKRIDGKLLLNIVKTINKCIECPKLRTNANFFIIIIFIYLSRLLYVLYAFH